MVAQKVEGEIGGRKLVFETGKLAKQANGSVLLQYGETVLLVTAVMSDEVREGIDFFPLTVEFREKSYASGKIPGGFFKREGRPTMDATLYSRLADRAIRPFFPEGFKNEVQVIATILSYDGSNSPDVQTINGASLALMLSDIPFQEPIAAVKMGYIDGKYIVNLPSEQEEESDLELVVAGTRNSVVMVESGSKELSEEIIIEAIKLAHEEIRKIIDIQEKMISQAAKPKIEVEVSSNGLIDELHNRVYERLNDILCNSQSKLERNRKEKEFFAELKEELSERIEAEEVSLKDLKGVFEEIEREIIRKKALEERKRIDGRGLDEIRPISCEVGLIPRTHGSALFTRGETQSLGILTLGTGEDEQLIDFLGEEHKKRFLVHYNFPPFSTGEVKPIRGPGRREIGHGALAERALRAVIPSKDDFPYTIRIVSEILESNGSSSMATVCSGTLALMDGGVKIKAPVSGIAMGLIKEGDKVAILSDIRGREDHHGDMDFKVAGTRKGITALQMDIKIKEGLSEEILKEALEQAKRGRLFILDEMEKAISTPREDISPYAPQVSYIHINPEKIGMVIGPGGKMIKSIIEETGVTIDIDEDGTVAIFSQDKESAEAAKKIVLSIVKDIEVGEVYDGTVKKITNFGAFVELLPGKEGLVHISEIAPYRIDKVEDVLHVGDKVKVKVIGIDSQSRINLSRKALLPGAEDGSNGHSRQHGRNKERRHRH
jgi:polyribonucleotide nucleotidyltransferase